MTMRRPMTPPGQTLRERLDALPALTADNRMPDELREQICHWIEPQTENLAADHEAAMDCIDLAYVLIVDYLSDHPHLLHDEAPESRAAA